MVIVVLFLLGASLIAIPNIVRALPGRYASLLPEPFQELRHSDHPITLPTPEGTVAQGTLSSTSTPTMAPSATPTVVPTDTPLDTIEPTETPEPTATPTPTPTLPAQARLEGGRHERQGWNNCGPTTLAMALSFWGFDDTQHDVAPVLKPDPEDKHVGIHQMAEYAEGRGLHAIIRSGGTLDGLKRLLAAGYPVIIESWYVRDARDQLGHYRLVVGYDDAAQLFDLYDSLYDPPTAMGYQELYELWRVFDWTYLIVAPSDRWDEALALIGPDNDDGAMYEAALNRALAEAESPPPACVAYAACDDWVTFSWYTAGTNLTALGRHDEASAAYDRARQLGLHYRMLWYQFGPYESYFAVGRYADVIALADATLATASNLEESLYWRAKAHVGQGETASARTDLQTALRYHPDWAPAVALLSELGE
jgi:tetratricopeptide (TPR) repeat protein